jgi:signal transduction histidine kinase
MMVAVSVGTRGGLLIRFVEMTSSARDGAAMLPLLCDAAVDELGATGAVVVQVDDADTARVVAARDVPEMTATWRGEGYALGRELGDALVATSNGRFAHADVFPLVSSGELYGSFILLFAQAGAGDPELREQAGALADLTGALLGRVAHMAELDRAYRDLQASREALAHADKLRALGQMAASVSHDLRNILNPLSIQLNLLRRRLGEPERAQEVVDRIAETLRHGIELVTRVRDFSRHAPEPEPVPHELDVLASAAVDILRPQLLDVPGIRLDVALVPTRPVALRGSGLVSALVNLVLNAMEAMPEGTGSISIATGGDDEGSWVEVADTGPGMPPEIANAAFDPFFTTKANGSGLGLPMVRELVQQHGGRLTLDTAPGRGARFRLWFRAAAA